MRGHGEQAKNYQAAKGGFGLHMVGFVSGLTDGTVACWGLKNEAWP